MREIFEILGIDKKVKYIGQKITKKMFYTQVDLSKDDERIFIDFIDKIEMSYVLDSKNINIDIFVNEEYNYSAIGYMIINLKKEDKIDKIANIIQNSIPNPLVIIFEYQNKFCVSTSLKRVNKNDSSKVVVEEINSTPFIDLNNLNENYEKFINSINISNLDYSNFFNFYKGIDDKIFAFKNLKVIGIYEEDNQNIKKTKEIIEKINIYNEELKKLVSQIKKETQFNKKMKLNVEANKIKSEIETLKNFI